MRSFHYGLRPDGHLFLGSSESVMRATKLFRVKDKKHRIFERRDAPIAALPPFSTGVSGGDRTALDAQAISNDDALDASIRRAMDKHNPHTLCLIARTILGKLIRLAPPIHDVEHIIPKRVGHFPPRPWGSSVTVLNGISIAFPP